MRASAARTLARPDYYDLVPFSLIDKEDSEIRQGNPELEATRAWNFDLTLDGRFGSTGTLSVSGFAKALDGFIFERRSTVLLDGEGFEATHPENGHEAELYGLEVSVRQHLPRGFFYRLGLAFTSSTAELRDRPGDFVRLPGQSAGSGSLILGTDAKKFSLNLGGSYAGSYPFELGSTSAEDVYVDEYLRWDLSATVHLTPRWQLLLLANNLTNEPHRHLQGNQQLLIQQEYVGRSASLGLRWNL